ncbi:MAG: methyltransferase domain-containing protein [Bdellovibrionales bacterium]|nr:methyltransferase domain-containing protein [Bdellovibrionales bacterium]
MQSMDPPSSFLTIDANGLWFEGSDPIKNDEYVALLLGNLRQDRYHGYVTQDQERSFIVEAFDYPLVAQSISVENGNLTVHLPYGLSKSITLKQVYLDDWDRFVIMTSFSAEKSLTISTSLNSDPLIDQLPLVLSRAAQTQLFDILDQFDDESVTFHGIKYPVENWYYGDSLVETPHFWTSIYQNEKPGWDLGRETAILNDILPQLKLPKSRILVVGCGGGHDAAYLAQKGHIVTGIDFSEEAIARSRTQYGQIKNLQFKVQDIFSMPKEYWGYFDLIYEHTCYCAVNPSRRNELVRIWHKLLSESGHFLGILFAWDKRQGPPWGGSEWEVRQRLDKYFKFIYWTRWRRSIPERQGKELVVYAAVRNGEAVRGAFGQALSAHRQGQR